MELGGTALAATRDSKGRDIWHQFSPEGFGSSTAHEGLREHPGPGQAGHPAGRALQQPGWGWQGQTGDTLSPQHPVRKERRTPRALSVLLLLEEQEGFSGALLLNTRKFLLSLFRMRFPKDFH